MYQRTPIVNAYYSDDSGHYLSYTLCPSKAYAGATMAAGSPESKLPYNFMFICSRPGYERVQMPYLPAMYEIPEAFDVLFRSQINSCLSLWKLSTSMLGKAWDHDDAFECGRDQVPIKVHVESYRAHAMLGYDESYVVYAQASSSLRNDCKRYFDEHADLSFENEGLVRLVRRATTSGPH
jgi:hypothetical protein